MAKETCIFCKIVRGEIAAEFVYKDEQMVVFHDLYPKAKHHFLVVPTVHVETFLDLQDNHFPLLTNMIKVVQHLIKDKKLHGAYRIVINGGRHQEVPHLHLHLLGD